MEKEKAMLVGGFELFEETGVVFREEAEVVDAVLQVGDALNTHAESVAGINLGINAALVEYVGVDHATAKDLDPACVLAEATTLATADEARDVHLGAGLGEWEV